MDEPLPKRSGPAGRRGPRLSPDPTISIVVLSDRKRESLEARLASLLAQPRDLAVEIMVVRAGSNLEERHDLERAYPSVRFIFLPSATDGARLRAAGMAAADGDIVTFIDERRHNSMAWVTKLPWRTLQRPPTAAHTR